MDVALVQHSSKQQQSFNSAALFWPEPGCIIAVPFRPSTLFFPLSKALDLGCLQRTLLVRQLVRASGLAVPDCVVTSSQQGLLQPSGGASGRQACRIRMHPHVPDRSGSDRRLPQLRVTHAAASPAACLPFDPNPLRRTTAPLVHPLARRPAVGPQPLVKLLRAGSRHLRCQCHSSLVERRAGQLPPWRHQPRQPAFIARSGPHALPPSDASEHPAITLPSTNADLHPPRRI